MPFNLNSLKNIIRDELRDHLYSRCLYGTVEAGMSTISAGSTINVSFAESITPYSKCYSKASPYSYTIPVTFKARKYGSPDTGIVVSLQTDSNGQPSGSTLASSSIPAASIPTSLSTVSTSLKISSMLGSKTSYWLVFEPKNTASTVDYFSIGRDSVDTHYLVGTAYNKEEGGTWSPLNVDLYFNFAVRGWIYSEYPRMDLSLHNYPRIAVDIVDRPRVDSRWIDRSYSEYILQGAIVVYSLYQDELDDLISLCDRVLFSSRTSLSNIRILDPGRFTPIAVIDENKLSRAIRFNFKYRMSADY